MQGTARENGKAECEGGEDRGTGLESSVRISDLTGGNREGRREARGICPEWRVFLKCVRQSQRQIHN